MRQLGRPYLQHAGRHLRQGSDPLPFAMPGDIPDAFNPTYAFFSKVFTAVASDTETDFDLSTATSVSTNETAATLGSSWTGANFLFDTSDPLYLSILTDGLYAYEASLWLGDGTTPTGPPFSAKIEETGSAYLWGCSGASALTQQYLDPSFTGGSPHANSNMNVFRHSTWYFGNPHISVKKRGLSFGHNYGSALDIAVNLAVFRMASA